MIEIFPYDFTLDKNSMFQYAVLTANSDIFTEKHTLVYPSLTKFTYYILPKKKEFVYFLVCSLPDLDSDELSTTLSYNPNFHILESHKASSLPDLLKYIKHDIDVWQSTFHSF